MADGLYENHINNSQGNGTHTHVVLHGHTALMVVLLDEAGGAPNLTTHIDEADLGTAGAGNDYLKADAVCASVTAGAGGPAYGSLDHTTVTWTSVAADTFESLVYLDQTSAVAATNPLICNIDTATGLPLTTNGANVTWEPNASGVFQQTST
jgi:hypothetical protein